MGTDINIKKRIAVQEESVTITSDVNSINFTGSGVSASAIGDDVTVTIPGSVGSTVYYLNASITEAPYLQFASTPTAGPQQIINSGLVPAGLTVDLEGFQTPVGVPNTTVIPSGLWQFFIHFAGTPGDTWDIFVEVYTVDLFATETLVLTTDPISVSTLSATPTMILTDGVFPTTSLLTTDRIIVKIKLTNTSAGPQSLDFYTEGSTYYSVGTTTLNQIVPTGAVTSVTGTAPVVSSGGTTPAISMAQADSVTDGYLSSTDWNTFNNKLDDNIYTADGTLTGNRTVTMSSNTLNFSGGNVGINQPTPTVPLHIKSIAVASTNEQLIRGEVSDAAGAYVAISNAALTDGEFVAEIVGRQSPSSSQSAIIQGGYIDATKDSGTTPVTVFRSALASLAPVVTRPLFSFRNWSTSVMTILANGKVGVGTTSPSTQLHVTSTAIPSTGEPIARFDVSDASGYMQIVNGTSTNGVYSPLIQGRQTGISTQPAFQTEGIIDVADDIGTTPVNIFKARLNTLAQVVTRPVFQFSNWTLDIVTMLSNGNVGIGTTTPTEKLEVNGKTKTTDFQMTTSPTAGYVLTSDASGNGTWSAAAGGLIYFTEAQSTSAPNATVPVDSLTAVSAATNADIAIVPKGTGSFMLDIPDGNVTGGDKRGSYSVDLQMSRSLQIQVVAGNYSFAAGADNRVAGSYAMAVGQTCIASNNWATAIGRSNTASGDSSVALGFNSTASNDRSVAIGETCSATGISSVAIGATNTVSGSYGVGIGYLNAATDSSTALGRSNTVNSTFSAATGNGNTHAAGAIYSFTVGRDNIISAAATNSFVAGYNNTASADRTVSIGSSNASSGSGSVSIGNTLIASGNNSLALGLNSSTQSVNGKQAYASGRFLTNGDAQKGLLVLRAATSSNTATTLTSDAGVAAATNQLFINTFSTIRFKGTIVGRDQGGGSSDLGVWDIDGVLSRTTGVISLVIGNVNLVTNPASYGTPTLAVDTVNKTLRVQVTGLVGISAQWVATIETTEVIYV